MVFFVLIILSLFIVLASAKPKYPVRGPIIAQGRNPIYYDIMEEEMAPLKAKLEKDSKNGVVYKSKTCVWNGKSFVPVSEGVKTAEETLKEFNDWEKNGYM